jgi:hypothetical protein
MLVYVCDTEPDAANGDIWLCTESMTDTERQAAELEAERIRARIAAEDPQAAVDASELQR